MKDNFPEFIKYPKILHIAEIPSILNNYVEVYEKLDGGNTQVRMYKGRILAGNRSKFLTDKDIRFPWFNIFLKWAKGNYSFYNLPENLIVFGEWLSPHNLEYPKEKQNKFYVIDVLDVNTNKFFSYEQARNLLEQSKITSLEFLPLISSGKICKKDLEKFVHFSNYREGNTEGIVVKDYVNQQFAKLWTSSIRRKFPLTYLDLQRTYFSLEESGFPISKKSLKSELYQDLVNSGVNISFWEVTDLVEKNYLSLNPNLKRIQQLSRHL